MQLDPSRIEKGDQESESKKRNCQTRYHLNNIFRYRIKYYVSIVAIRGARSPHRRALRARAWLKTARRLANKESRFASDYWFQISREWRTRRGQREVGKEEWVFLRWTFPRINGKVTPDELTARLLSSKIVIAIKSNINGRITWIFSFNEGRERMRSSEVAKSQGWDRSLRTNPFFLPCLIHPIPSVFKMSLIMTK